MSIFKWNVTHYNHLAECHFLKLRKLASKYMYVDVRYIRRLNIATRSTSYVYSTIRFQRLAGIVFVSNGTSSALFILSLPAGLHAAQIVGVTNNLSEDFWLFAVPVFAFIGYTIRCDSRV